VSLGKSTFNDEVSEDNYNSAWQSADNYGTAISQ